MASPRRIIGTVATVAALALPAVFSNAALAREDMEGALAAVTTSQLTTTVAAEKVHFAPMDVHISPGTTVVWTNNDPFAHTITSDDGLFDSGLINQGETFSFTFTELGTYQYYCLPHVGPGLNGMAGTIVVEAPGAGEAPADTPAPVEAPAVVEEPTTVDAPVVTDAPVVEEPAPVEAPSTEVVETPGSEVVIAPEGADVSPIPVPSSEEAPAPETLVGDH